MLCQLGLDQLTLVDIADDDELLSNYGTRIPVLHRIDNSAELNWPFTKSDITELMKA